KAGGEDNHHIGREIAAFREFTEPLANVGVCARLTAADLELNLMALEYLDGEPVEGSEAEFTPETYEQAGRVLRAFHGQSRRVDPDAERLASDRAIAWLDAGHRIDRHHEDAAREILTGDRPQPVTVVPTHGDWQPRNWLIHHGQVRVIDFGRFAWRSAES